MGFGAWSGATAIGSVIGLGAVGYGLVNTATTKYGSNPMIDDENRRLLLHGEYSTKKYVNSGPAGASVAGVAGIGMGLGLLVGGGLAVGAKSFGKSFTDNISDFGLTSVAKKMNKKVKKMTADPKTGKETPAGTLSSAFGGFLNAKKDGGVSNSTALAIGLPLAGAAVGGVIGAQAGGLMYEQGIMSSIHNYTDSRGGSDVRGAEGTSRPVTPFGAVMLGLAGAGTYGLARAGSNMLSNLTKDRVTKPILQKVIGAMGSKPMSIGITGALAYSATTKLYGINKDPNRNRIQGMGR